MKIVCVLLVLLPALASAAPGKRYFLDTLTGPGGIISMDALKQDMQIMLDILGSDPTEQACEQEGHKLIHDGVLVHSVPLICHSFQALVQHFHLVQDTTTASAVKRLIFDSTPNWLSAEALKQDVQMLLNVLGSDPTEQACEQEARKLLTGLMEHSAPLICRSFQELVHRYQLTPNTA